MKAQAHDLDQQLHIMKADIAGSSPRSTLPLAPSSG